MKSIGLTSIFFLIIHGSLTFAGWANIEIARGADRIEKVVLENSKIRVTYATSLNGWAHRSPICITEFYVKSINKELVENGRFDDMLDPFEGGDHTKPIQYRAKLLGATLIHDGADKKTLRLTWQNSSEEVSLFRNSSVLQIDYLKWYVLMTDWPGWRKDNLAYQEQMFSVYGADGWHRTSVKSGLEKNNNKTNYNDQITGGQPYEITCCYKSFMVNHAGLAIGFSRRL